MNTYVGFYGDTVRVELPTGSSRMATLAEGGDDLAWRLTMNFVRDEKGSWAVFGDNGSGVGATHQTG